MKPPPSLDKEFILHLKQLPITFILIKRQKQSVFNIVVMIWKWMADDGGGIYIVIYEGYRLQMRSMKGVRRILHYLQYQLHTLEK